MAVIEPLNFYAPSDRDTGATDRYFGFVATDGRWYIRKETVSGTVTITRYVKGTTTYATNWGNRAILTYAQFDSVFP